jgi:hypothetical protein
MATENLHGTPAKKDTMCGCGHTVLAGDFVWRKESGGTLCNRCVLPKDKIYRAPAPERIAPPRKYV